MKLSDFIDDLEEEEEEEGSFLDDGDSSDDDDEENEKDDKENEEDEKDDDQSEEESDGDDEEESETIVVVQDGEEEDEGDSQDGPGRPEKDIYEKIEEEIEDMVRNEPDNWRNRELEDISVDTGDPDIEGDPDTSEDEDLSMNYKDIGGSSRRSLHRLALRRAKKAQEEPEGGGGDPFDEGGGGDEPAPDEGGGGDPFDEGGGREEPPEGGEEGGDPFEGGGGGGAPAGGGGGGAPAPGGGGGGGAPAGGDEPPEGGEDQPQEGQQQGQPQQDQEEDEDDEDEEKDKKEYEEEEKGGILREFRENQIMERIGDLEDATDEEIRQAAIQWSDEPAGSLYGVMHSTDTSHAAKRAAEKALKMKVSPVPPQWEREKVFEGGHLTLRARQDLLEHMKNWDVKTFMDNLQAVKQKQVATALTSGSEKKERYFDVILEVMKEAKEKFLPDAEPIQSVEEALRESFEGNGDELFDEKDKEKLMEDVERWEKRLKRTRLGIVKDLLSKVRDLIEKTDSSLSKKYTWLAMLEDTLEGAKAMKQTSKDIGFGEDEGKDKKSSRSSNSRLMRSSIRRGLNSDRQKTSEYLGAPGPVQDGFEPVQNDWQADESHHLGADDYVQIVKKAIKWIEDKPEKMSHMMEYDQTLALETALEHAMWDYTKEGFYEIRPDAVAYNDMMDVLVSYYEKNDE